MNVLEAKNIDVLYAGEMIIKNMSLPVKKGEIVALVGKSGVGKTTFFHVLTGLLYPNKGEIFYLDKNITGQKGKLGYMLQKDLLIPHKTLYENVALPLVIAREKKSDIEIYILDLLEKFHLLAYKNHYPHQLSGGMRQKAAFLRTVVKKKEMLLLDEPFSHLDMLTKNDLEDWFLEMVRALHMSVLLITHDIDEAYYMADKIYIMTGKPGTIETKDILYPSLKEKEAIIKKDNHLKKF